MARYKLKYTGEEIDEILTNAANTTNQITSIEYDKQDTLVSGENIKTINGESILGEGDLTVSVSSSQLSKYALKNNSAQTITSSSYIATDAFYFSGYTSFRKIENQEGFSFGHQNNAGHVRLLLPENTSETKYVVLSSNSGDTDLSKYAKLNNNSQTIKSSGITAHLLQLYDSKEEIAISEQILYDSINDFAILDFSHGDIPIIRGIEDPIENSDVATKKYVDSKGKFEITELSNSDISSTDGTKNTFKCELFPDILYHTNLYTNSEDIKELNLNVTEGKYSIFKIITDDQFCKNISFLNDVKWENGEDFTTIEKELLSTYFITIEYDGTDFYGYYKIY